MANFELYKSSFAALADLDKSLSAAANKNKISTGALILLLALNNGIDLSQLFRAEFANELINMGFLQKTENAFSVTGKGAILAKSLERIL